MMYFIEAVNANEEAARIQDLVDFSWDSERIFVVRCNDGLLVDFGEPLGAAVTRLIRKMGRHVCPVMGVSNGSGWQVVHTHSTSED